MELLINGANLIYLISYSVRDILWLRILTVVAAVLLVVYFYQLAQPLYTAIGWNFVFIGLNLFWIIRLVMERRSVKLEGNDLRLYQLAFRSLTPREMAKLLKLGVWMQSDTDSSFIEQGEALDRLMVICVGSACIVQNGRRIEELGPGQFIGGEAYISAQNAPADVIALETTYTMCWKKRDLKAFMASHPELSSALTLTLGFDIANRLQGFHQNRQHGQMHSGN
jgi:hypothetical protein